MKIELKNVKHYPSMSEETNCFQADIVINGVNAGSCKNGGYGGSTDCMPHGKHQALFKSAENYCKSLPPMQLENFTLDMNLENYVDDLFEAWAKKKHEAKEENRLKKDCLKGLCCGTKREYSVITWKNHTIESLLKHPQGLNALTNAVAKAKAEGRTILNTNLPKGLL